MKHLEQCVARAKCSVPLGDVRAGSDSPEGPARSLCCLTEEVECMGWLQHLELISRLPYEKMEGWGESLTPKASCQEAMVFRAGKGLTDHEVWIQRERGEIRHPFSFFLLSPEIPAGSQQPQCGGCKGLVQPAWSPPADGVVFRVSMVLNREEARSHVCMLGT